MPGSRSEGLMSYLSQPFPLLSALLTCSWLVSSTSGHWFQHLVQQGSSSPSCTPPSCLTLSHLIPSELKSARGRGACEHQHQDRWAQHTSAPPLQLRQAENLRPSYGPQSLVVQQPRDIPGRGTVSSASAVLPCCSSPLPASPHSCSRYRS